MLRLQRVKTNRRQRCLRVRAKAKAITLRPRLSVHISLKHIRAQVIDQADGRVLVAVSTLKAKQSEPLSQQATQVGRQIAELCQKAQIEAVVFDRGSRFYGRRLRNLTKAARQEGLKF